MKTAISLPDEILEEAKAFARRLGISRSELYATAIAGYVSEHRKARVTEKLNEVYGEGASALDPVLSAMQLSSLERTFLTERIGRMSARQLQQVESGIRLVLSL